MAKTIDLKRLSSEIYDAVEKIKGIKLKALGEVKQRQIALSSLMKLEARRLTRKIGRDDPRVDRLKVRIAHNSDIIRGLEAVSQISRIKRPAADIGIIAHQGRITDYNRRGITNLDISLTDSRGKPVITGLKARTDDSGYYALIVEPEDASKIEAAAKKGLILKIETEDGKTIHSEKDPLKLASGAGTLAEVMVDRQKIFERPIRVTPVKKKKTTGKSVNVAAEMDLKKVKGIGPRAEAKLKKAGIKNVRELAGSDDARIKAALGNVRADLLRKSALSVLKKTRGTPSRKGRR